jgi:hypothetical protein
VNVTHPQPEYDRQAAEGFLGWAIFTIHSHSLLDLLRATAGYRRAPLTRRGEANWLPASTEYSGVRWSLS